MDGPHWWPCRDIDAMAQQASPRQSLRISDCEVNSLAAAVSSGSRLNEMNELNEMQRGHAGRFPAAKQWQCEKCGGGQRQRRRFGDCRCADRGNGLAKVFRQQHEIRELNDAISVEVAVGPTTPVSKFSESVTKSFELHLQVAVRVASQRQIVSPVRRYCRIGEIPEEAIAPDSCGKTRRRSPALAPTPHRCKSPSRRSPCGLLVFDRRES